MHLIALWREQGPALRRIVAFQFLANLGAGVFVLLFNLYLLALGFREDVIGLVAGLNTLGQGLGALVAGRLVGRLGPPRVMTAALALFTIASAGQALSARTLPIVAWALVIGAATSWLSVPVMPFLTERVTPAARGDAAALAFGVQNLSLTIGTFGGGLLPALLAATGLALGQVGRLQAGLLIGITIGALGLFPLAGIGRQPGPGSARTQTALVGPALEATPRRLRRTVATYCAAAALLSIGAGAFLPFVNVYLVRLGASEGLVGAVLAASGATGALLGLATPPLARRLGPIASTVLLRLAPIPLALALAVFPTLGLAIGVFAVRTIGASMAWPVELGLLTERIPSRGLANAFGLRIASWNLAWAAVSVFAGQLIVRGGYNAPLYILAVFTALGTLALWSALRK